MRGLLSVLAFLLAHSANGKPIIRSVKPRHTMLATMDASGEIGLDQESPMVFNDARVASLDHSPPMALATIDASGEIGVDQAPDWIFMKNAPTEMLTGRSNYKSLTWKVSHDAAKKNCASDQGCQAYCWNPDDWTAYYPDASVKMDHIGTYGKGWQCYFRVSSVGRASTCGMNTAGKCFGARFQVTGSAKPDGSLLLGCKIQQQSNTLASFDSTLPSPVGKYFKEIIGDTDDASGAPVSKDKSLFSVCWGDRTGNWISERERFQNETFLNRLWIPKNDDAWGSFGFQMLTPCLTDISIALAVRTCTPSKVNFAFSVSPSAFVCKPKTPVQKAIKLVDEFTFGLSLDRAFGEQVQIVTGDGTTAALRNVDARMHFFTTGELAFTPEKYFPFPPGLLKGAYRGVQGISFDGASRELLKSIAENGASSVLDFQKSLQQCASRPITALSSADRAGYQKEGLSSAAIDMISACGEGYTMTSKVTGDVIFNLDIISKGLLPSFTAKFVQQSIVTKVSNKKDGASGTDGLDAGIYFYREGLPGSSSDVTAFANTLLKRFSGLFGKLGINVGSFSFPATGGGVGIYINQAGCGFIAKVAINSKSIDLTCNFRLDNNRFRCSSTGVNTVIEAVLDGGDWVFSKAQGAASEVISKISVDKIRNNPVGITTDLIDSGANLVKTAGNTIVEGGKTVWTGITNIFR